MRTYQNWCFVCIALIGYLAAMKLLHGPATNGQLLHLAPLLASALSSAIAFALFLYCNKRLQKPKQKSEVIFGAALVAVGLVVLNQSFLYLTRNAIDQRVMQIVISYIFALVVSTTPFLISERSRHSHKILLYSALAVVGLVSVWAALKSNWYHLNPDGISYYSIAEHYASGDFKEAINAYWSPFLSWLLAPFILLGLEANTAYRLSVAGTGVLIVYGVTVLARRVLPSAAKSTQGLIYSMILVTSLFCIAVIHSGLITPDLLTVAWTVWLCVLWNYISEQKKFSGENWVRWSALFGAYGALGFYIKGFLLPFFVLSAAVLLFMTFWFKGLSKVRVVKVSFMTLFILAILIAPWVGTLKYKYDAWMTGSSSKYNLAWIGPSSVEHPISNQILEPPHDKAAGAWEDPTNHPYTAWSPAGSLADLQFHIFVNVHRNIKDILGFLNAWTFASAVVIVGGVTTVFLLRRKAKSLDRRMDLVFVLSLLSMLYIAGYVAVHVVGGDRYLWPVLAIHIPLFVLVISMLLESADNKQILAIWVFCSLVMLQFVGLYVNSMLKKNLNDNDNYYSIAESMSEYIPRDSRFVANSLIPGFYIAYKLDLKFYGVLKQNFNETQPSNFSEYNINYFFCLKTKSDCGFSRDMLVWESKNRLNKVYKVGTNE